jgi:hypothetical protein
MFNAEAWVAQELAKHTTPESRAKRLDYEMSFHEVLKANPLKRPSNVSARDWAESHRSYDLLISALQAA